MASTHSARRALSAVLLRALQRVTFVGGLVVAGWLLGSAPGMALVPGVGELDSPVSGQQDEPSGDTAAATGLSPVTPTILEATDAVGGITESAGSSGGSSDQESEATSEAPPADEAPADQSPADQSPADQSPADEAPSTEIGTAASSDPEPPEPVTATAPPVTELTARVTEPAVPVVELTEPVVELTEPVVERAEPVLALTEPVVERAEPVLALTEPVLALTGGVVGLSERPAPVDAVASPDAATQSAPAPAVTSALTVVASPPPVLGSLAGDVALPASGTAVPEFAPFGAVDAGAADSATASSTVDDLMAQGPWVAPLCSSGASPAGGSGSATALPGSNGALTPPAGPVGALAHPPVTVAPGLLAQRPSTSPD